MTDYGCVLASFLAIGCGSVATNTKPDASADTSTPGADADTTPRIKVAVFDDFDPDYSSAPFEDRLTIVTYEIGTKTYTVDSPRKDLNTSQTIGGVRGLSVSPDGSRIALVQNVTGTIEVHDAAGAVSGTPITSASFMSVYLTNDRVFTASTSNTAGIRAYDLTTRSEVAGSPSTTIMGIEVAVDTARNIIWTTGNKLWRGDATTLQGVEKATFGFNAVSIDLASDGSVWVAERSIPTAGTNALRHFDGTGGEIRIDARAVNASTSSVRVHPTTGEIWYSTASGIGRFDSAGTNHPVDSTGQFFSLSIDKATGIVFAGGGVSNPVVRVFGPAGEPLTTISGFSTSQKYVAVIP